MTVESPIPTPRPPSSSAPGLRPSELLPFFSLIALHTVLAWRMDRPIVFSDEIAYLSHARMFAGQAPYDLYGATAFFNAGYGVFIAPIIKLIADPVMAYRAVIIMNGVVMSCLYFPLRWLTRELFDQSGKTASIIAFVASLYPATLMEPKMAWVEGFIVPIFMTMICAFYALVRKPSIAGASALTTLTTFAFFVHPRMLPVVVVVHGYLLVLGLLRRLEWRAVLAASCVGAVGMLTVSGIHSVLLSTGFHGMGGRSFSLMLSTLLTPAGIWTNVITGAGQAWYLLASTYGLVGLGALLIASRVRLGVQDPRAHTALFFLLSALVILGATVLNMVYAMSVEGVDSSLDYYICGRQNETYSPLMLCAGLVFAREHARRFFADRRVIVVMLLACAFAALVFVGRGAHLMTAHIVGSGIFGLLPLLSIFGGARMLPITAITLAGMIVLLGLARWRWGAALVVLVLFFCASNYRVYQFLLDEHQPRALLTTHIPADVHDVGYDMANVSWAEYWLYQFRRPDIRFHRFNSNANERSPFPLLIANPAWTGPRHEGAQRIAVDEIGHQALWRDGDGWFGAEPMAGIEESGFHGVERIENNAPVRWTNGHAHMSVPLHDSVPRAFTIRTDPLSPTQWLRVIVNGRVALTARADGIAEHRMPLDVEPNSRSLEIDIETSTFVPHQDDPASTDTRTLGVRIYGLRFD